MSDLQINYPLRIHSHIFTGYVISLEVITILPAGEKELFLKKKPHYRSKGLSQLIYNTKCKEHNQETDVLLLFFTSVYLPSPTVFSDVRITV